VKVSIKISAASGTAAGPIRSAYRDLLTARPEDGFPRISGYAGGLTEKSFIERIAESYADEIYNYWYMLALQKFRSATADRYTRHLSRTQKNKNVWEVAFEPEDDSLSYWLENGLSPYDIRAAMLKSAKVKFSKRGTTYIDVPFEHTTDESGQHIGVPIGHAYASAEARGTYNPPQYFPAKAIKKVMAYELSQLGPRERVSPDAVPKMYPHHTQTIYGGMHARSDPGSLSGDYITFRRISSGVDKGNWQHPGIRGAFLRDLVVEDAEQLLDAVLVREVQDVKAEIYRAGRPKHRDLGGI
jgi:hypothetical protein